jgi:hypothetical protein
MAEVGSMQAKLDWTGWLGREDSNLRMAESKSEGSGNDFKAHSEKIPKCGPISINKLVDISEFRVSERALTERRVSAPSHLMSQLASIVVPQLM